MRYDTSKVAKSQLARVLTWFSKMNETPVDSPETMELLQKSDFNGFYELWQTTMANLVSTPFGDPALQFLTDNEEELRMVGSYLRIMDTKKAPAQYAIMVSRPSEFASKQFVADLNDFIEIYHRGDEPPCHHEKTRTISFVIDEKDWKELTELGKAFFIRPSTVVKEFSGYGFLVN